MSRPLSDKPKALTVLYDGACPLCSREIAWYQRKTASESIDWQDLSIQPDAALPCGISHNQAMARFHVIEPDGHVITGARAFIRLWKAFPGLEKFALIARLPLVAHLLEGGYRLFLVFRPLLPRRTDRPDTASKPPASPDCSSRKQ
mgnify:CR=1 FL=1